MQKTAKGSCPKATHNPFCFMGLWVSVAVCLFTLGTPPGFWGKGPSHGDRDPLKGYTIVRCLFGEGRLVVRYKGRLWVIHKGESLPDSSWHVAEFSEHQVRLTRQREKDGGPTHQQGTPADLILITDRGQGKVAVQTVLSPEEMGTELQERPLLQPNNPPGASVRIETSKPAPSEPGNVP